MREKLDFVAELVGAGSGDGVEERALVERFRDLFVVSEEPVGCVLFGKVASCGFHIDDCLPASRACVAFKRIEIEILWTIGFRPDDSVQAFRAFENWGCLAFSAVMTLWLDIQSFDAVYNVLSSTSFKIALNPGYKSVLIIILADSSCNMGFPLLWRCVLGPETMSTLPASTHDRD